MPPASMSREELVGLLTEVFRRHGYDGASMAEISAATGLGRSSLYHWFPGGKQEMAAVVLDATVDALKSELHAALTAPEPLQARLDRVLAALDRLYDGGRKPCLVERLCASAARVPLQGVLRDAIESWIGAMASLLREGGVAEPDARDRAEDAVVRVQGALVLCAAVGEPSAFRRVLGDLSGRFLGVPGA
jgi:TetR/AcrR family transcriptional regulator, lmrAB and yxaGH operons repressor